MDTRSEDAQRWLQAVSSEQRINECESLAALLGVSTLGSFLQDADVMHFVDSTAAEGILIKGYSRSRTLAAISGAYWSTASQHCMTVWIGRVPSKLNVADGPTRNDLSIVNHYGWTLTQPYLVDASSWWALLGSVPLNKTNKTLSVVALASVAILAQAWLALRHVLSCPQQASPMLVIFICPL